MSIRSFQSGDESAQAAIFNTACGGFPGFKPASADDVRRRTRARTFDPSMRLYAEDKGQVVGYCTFQPNGRISYPWCLPGREQYAEPLFAAVMDGLKARGISRVFAAYHKDWQIPARFFADHGMAKARDMVNFILNPSEMPTISAKPGSVISPLAPADLSSLYALAPELWHGMSQRDLWRHLFENPHFPPEFLFALRSRTDQRLLAVGILIDDPSFADPEQLDASQPCFRLGSFGGEWEQTKRVRGMFSVAVAGDRNAPVFALDLLGHAASMLDGSTPIAAQVPSDAQHLLSFYQSHFRRQGEFPIFEMTLG